MDIKDMFKKTVGRVAGGLRLLSDFIFKKFSKNGVSSVAVFRLLWIVSITTCVVCDYEFIAALLFLGMSIDPEVSSNKFSSRNYHTRSDVGAFEKDTALSLAAWIVSALAMAVSGHFVLCFITVICMVISEP
ncbi:hypothetical protein [Photobacterium kishitanii]|uniref:Uncharacterized protein n=1 Tax=Photobacterium kishitanii TaxID=318456 RepID=A0A2T3KMC5_9GAMM|nr:hypothetical protein [Photobacterium kishitanii]PSV00934.1 hypothetical protein C9J27_02610 [Photobacterium kishitanii]